MGVQGVSAVAGITLVLESASTAAP